MMGFWMEIREIRMEIREIWSVNMTRIPDGDTLHQTASHCNTLQHTATHCNTLQHTATQCNTLQHTATYLSATHMRIDAEDVTPFLYLWHKKNIFFCHERPFPSQTSSFSRARNYATKKKIELQIALRKRLSCICNTSTTCFFVTAERVR